MARAWARRTARAGVGVGLEALRGGVAQVQAVMPGAAGAAVFATVALGGAGLLNVATKLTFARERPTLWQSIAPETTYSFPSGHAMGSMSLALVLVLLCWPTRWRWPVLAAMAVFAPLANSGSSAPVLS